jgi:NAD+ diphosphatase
MMTPRYEFVPSTRFFEPPRAGLWFAFRKRELLLGDDGEVPRLTSPAALGLTVVRTQFLGTLDGTACFSAELPPASPPPPQFRFADLRRVYELVPEPLMALAGRALQIVDWDRTHQFCGACASPTVPHDKARARVCRNHDCALELYPRIAPAVIMLVERGDEVLLARSPHFPPGIYSALAGFVDPGESLEAAVHREVFEETGIRIQNVRYFGSQPWPFPHSLMVAFVADYASGEIVADGDEIEDARFFPCDALPETFRSRISISRWLLDDFLLRHAQR